MSQGFDVDTDVLRAMAQKVRRVIGDLAPFDMEAPTRAGHDGVIAAGSDFRSAWSCGLSARATDSHDFADRIDQTARVFDEGDDAAKAELDAMIWGL